MVQDWEAAVEGVLEDGLFTLNEENALTRYINHCNLMKSEQLVWIMQGVHYVETVMHQRIASPKSLLYESGCLS